MVKFIAFDPDRQDNHCWIKFMGIDWRITKMKGHILFLEDGGAWREKMDWSGLRLDEYTQKAQDMIMEAYK